MVPFSRLFSVSPQLQSLEIFSLMKTEIPPFIAWLCAQDALKKMSSILRLIIKSHQLAT